MPQFEALAPTKKWSAAQLASAVAAAFIDDALIHTPDCGTAAFALPVATATAAPVAVVLEAQAGEIPWRLQSFAAADTLPEPLSGVWPKNHVHHLNQLMVQPHATLDTHAVCKNDDRLKQEMAQAFARVQISPRLAVFAYDPMSDTPLLLIPLAAQVMVITPTGDRSYRALALLTREEARAIAHA